MRTIGSGGAMVWVLLLAGCQLAPSGDLTAARQAYDGGNYRDSYRAASRIVDYGGSAPDPEAAYLAGASAYRLRQLGDAERYLKLAIQGGSRQQVGVAMAMLGLVYTERGAFSEASRALVSAGERLQGMDRANAYYYAARAEHRLGRYATARTYLALARQATGDEAFRDRITQLLGATGYTLQLGPFERITTARAVAQELAARTEPLAIGLPVLAQLTNPDGSRGYFVQLGQFSSYTIAAGKRAAIGRDDIAIVELFQVQEF